VSSEWLKVMLEEIARKKDELEQVRLEEQRRSEERPRGDELRHTDEPHTDKRRRA
jgi:hypothetical protein